MLWYKAWLETRWRFLIGLVLLAFSAAATVFTYPAVAKLMPMARPNVSGVFAQRILEEIDLARSYRGFMWSHWFRQNLAQWSTLFAILLGTAGVLSPSRGALFTLSLPVTRARLLAVRAATGLAELFALALVPSLLVPLLSPSIQQTYAVGPAVIHSVCHFIGVSVFFSLAFLLSTMFDDVWAPLLIAVGIAFVLSLFDQTSNHAAFSIFRVMSAESYFRSGQLPWTALLVAAIVSTAMCLAAAAGVARRDF